MSSDSRNPGNEAGKPKKSKRTYGKGSRKNVRRKFGQGAYIERSASRHQSRVLAMQTLFEFDTTDHELDEIIGRIHFDESELPDSVRETADADEIAVDNIPAEVARHADLLARGTVANLPEIDPTIEKAAPAFPIDQIAAVDRNVLRLAIYELMHQADVPVGVAINEAVEIAKRFGGPNSSKFVNGVLGTISRQLPKERQA